MTFKGLHKDKYWVHGTGIVPNRDNRTAYIVDYPNDIVDSRIVDIDTVCVSTGVTDTGGNEVFEKDIIRITNGTNDYFYIVMYDKKNGQFYLVNSDVRFDTLNEIGIYFKIVGNMHTDHDLLNRSLKKADNAVL